MSENRFIETGLQFFGTVNASVSHEIKNRMAVINEQAGLLKDLVALAEKGNDLSLERLKRLAEALKTQVALTDAIIRNMNRFAHSVDSFLISIDICDLLTLTVALAKRIADNRGVHIETRLPSSSFSLKTAPFFLMHLVWQCLEAMMDLGTSAHTVLVECAKNEGGAQICFSTDGVSGPAENTLSDSALELASAIQAVVAFDEKKNRIRIELPDRMQSF